MICVIGKVHEIKDSRIHLEAVTCLVKLWDTLEQARVQAVVKNINMEFMNFSGIFFKAAFMPM